MLISNLPVIPNHKSTVTLVGAVIGVPRWLIDWIIEVEETDKTPNTTRIIYVPINSCCAVLCE